MGVVAVGLAVAACDDTDPKGGTRGICASGGAINDCPDPVVTPETVCWRMVECGAIPVESEMGGLDWASCVGVIEGSSDERATFIMACVAASACDELVSNSEYRPCFEFGSQ
jgi:hypothetical protein